MSVITAAQAQQMKRDAVPEEIKERFNDLITEGLKEKGEFVVHLHFDTFGYDNEDVQFVEDAGYRIYRNSACLWWEVRFKKED